MRGHMRVAVIAMLGVAVESINPAIGTCGKLFSVYEKADCCEKDHDVPEANCPYSFSPLQCEDAEPQAPRDLTQVDGVYAPGKLEPKALALNARQAESIPIVNVHFHLGAEHKTNAYQDSSDSDAWDAYHEKDHSDNSADRRLADECAGSRTECNVRPGFMCPRENLTEAEKRPYEFVYCKGDVKVGDTYEVHYVHSTAGYHKGEVDGVDSDLMSDGLGGAANGRGQLNPMVVVQAQVFQIVNGDDAPDFGDDPLKGWSVVGHEDSVRYAGSTTGQSVDNQVCSPYQVTWHVDKACHKIKAEAFDDLCKAMKNKYQLNKDRYPHGSRGILSKLWVVKPEYVFPLEK